MAKDTPGTFTERLWPSPSFFLALILIIPALTVLFTPFSLISGVIAGVIAYVMVVAIFLLSARKTEVQDGQLIAGRAAIPVEFLTEMQVLDTQELRVEIGRKLDARAYLWVSGWVRTGVKLVVNDPQDSTPYWIVTTRKPKALITVLREAQSATGQV